jgi:hypothetical protein
VLVCVVITCWRACPRPLHRRTVSLDPRHGTLVPFMPRAGARPRTPQCGSIPVAAQIEGTACASALRHHTCVGQRERQSPKCLPAGRSSSASKRGALSLSRASGYPSSRSRLFSCRRACDTAGASSSELCRSATNPAATSGRALAEVGLVLQTTGACTAVREQADDPQSGRVNRTRRLIIALRTSWGTTPRRRRTSTRHVCGRPAR